MDFMCSCSTSSLLLHGCSVAVGLLPQLASIGLSLAHRYRELIQGADVVREAAAVALDLGYPETAVEWLERGRSIVWGELFQLRSSYDELSSAHKKSLSSRLEQARSIQHHPMEFLQQQANRHRTLAIERDKLLQDIRGLPGFERFLLHKEFSQNDGLEEGEEIQMEEREIRSAGSGAQWSWRFGPCIMGPKGPLESWMLFM